jgi:hypothetical protein
MTTHFEKAIEQAVAEGVVAGVVLLARDKSGAHLSSLTSLFDHPPASFAFSAYPCSTQRPPVDLAHCKHD